MTLEEMLALEARLYVAMSEIDYELKSWYRWFYSPSRAVRRAAPYMSWGWTTGFRKGVLDAQAALDTFGSSMARHRRA